MEDTTWEHDRARGMKACLVGACLLFVLAMAIVTIGLSGVTFYNTQQAPPSMEPVVIE